jgi:hypothetical protein
MRRIFVRLIVTIGVLAGLHIAPALAGSGPKDVVLYKNPQCDCCERYADYLRKDGFAVKVIPTNELTMISQENGVPPQLQGCHTMLVDGYVVEGHVPLKALHRLLAERPPVKGIALPGMPTGAPGIGGLRWSPLEIYEFKGGQSKLFAEDGGVKMFLTSLWPL